MALPDVRVEGLAAVTREELVALCERAVVPEEKWLDRDSAEAQRQVGACWAQLKAGCRFDVHQVEGAEYDMNTDEDTVWLTVRAKGFQYVEAFEPGDDPLDYLDDESYYLPTPALLERAAGGDWYGA